MSESGAGRTGSTGGDTSGGLCEDLEEDVGRREEEEEVQGGGGGGFAAVGGLQFCEDVKEEGEDDGVSILEYTRGAPDEVKDRALVRA